MIVISETTTAISAMQIASRSLIPANHVISERLRQLWFQGYAKLPSAALVVCGLLDSDVLYEVAEEAALHPEFPGLQVDRMVGLVSQWHAGPAYAVCRACSPTRSCGRARGMQSPATAGKIGFAANSLGRSPGAPSPAPALGRHIDARPTIVPGFNHSPSMQGRVVAVAVRPHPPSGPRSPPSPLGLRLIPELPDNGLVIDVRGNPVVISTNSTRLAQPGHVATACSDGPQSRSRNSSSRA
jgi:hypothetical protein